MKELWVEMPEFSDNIISNYGEIANIKTGARRKNSITANGHCKISMYDSGNRLVTRSVAVLVADAFLPRPEPRFNTVIHLDGDLLNCRADNLMWRPRWFALRYHRQFRNRMFHNDTMPRIEINSGETYATLKDVCTTNGIYFYDVIKSCVEETFVPITNQEFRNLI